ncbi:MAG: prepilin-type N-terminal cleavage/methylation domain-containing protein [Patescibacteria group bacterium]
MQKRNMEAICQKSIVHCPLSIVRCASRRGFTLLEIALTIGILTILLALTLTVSMNAIGRSALQSAENVLVQTLRRAQTLSQQNVQELNWGVYLCPSVTTPGCASAPSSVILFQRTPPATFGAYNAGTDQSFEISSTITVSGTLYTQMTVTDSTVTPLSPPPEGLVFQRLLGKPFDPTFYGTIVLSMNDESRTITVTAKGVVEH